MSEVVKLERHDVIAIVTVNSPPGQRIERRGARRHPGMHQGCHRRSRSEGDRADLRGPHLYCRRRHHRIRQAAEAAGPRRSADRRWRTRRSRLWPRSTAPRSAAVLKSRSPAISGLRPRTPARPARSQARPVAGRRRYAAPAARGRSRARGQDDRRRRPDLCRRSAQERPDRGDRRRPGRRRRGLCPQGAGGETAVAQAAR